MSRSGRVYGVLLLAYPREFRRRFGGEMAQAFKDPCRDAELRGGALGVMMLWVRTMPDLMSTAIVERSRAARSRWLFALILLSLALGFAIAYVDSSPGGTTPESRRRPFSASAVCSGCSILQGPGCGGWR